MSRITARLLALACAGAVTVALPAARVAQTPDADLAEAERLFDAFEFEPALALLERLVERLSEPGAEGAELLARCFELRGRARFNLGQVDAAQEDFVRLLRLDAAYRLPADESPRLIELFDAVRLDTVGTLFVTMDPPGLLVVDGREIPMTTTSLILDLAAGPHSIAATLPGYREQRQDIVIAAGQSLELSTRLVRVFGSLTVASDPPGARVLVDGAEGGVTRGDTPDGPSAPVLVVDLEPGDHQLRLDRPCSVPYDVAFNIPDPPVDADIGVIELAPAVATAAIETNAVGAEVFVDGVRRGPAPARLDDVCAGLRVVEVRSPRGRFIDRREWRSGETVTLAAALRPAFALLPAVGAATRDERLPARVEEALGDARRVLVFAPAGQDAAALAGAAGLVATVVDGTSSELDRRETGARLAEAAGAQGVAWLTPEPDDADTVALSLLARGSGVPDVLTLRLADIGSRAAAVRALSAEPPPIVRPTLEASLVDVAGVVGAAVVRVTPGGVSERAGLTAGDLVVGVDGAAVSSVGEVRRALDGRAAGAPLALAVSGPAREGPLAVTPAEAPALVPLGDATRLSNLLLLEMDAAVAGADGPLVESAARLNLAVAHMRVRNWDLALAELARVTLPAGPGVSAGTVEYLTGLCLLEVSQLSDAEAAFRAAAGGDGHLFVGGPPVATLAQQRLAELLSR